MKNNINSTLFISWGQKLILLILAAFLVFLYQRQKTTQTFTNFSALTQMASIFELDKTGSDVEVSVNSSELLPTQERESIGISDLKKAKENKIISIDRRLNQSKNDEKIDILSFK